MDITPTQFQFNSKHLGLFMSILIPNCKISREITGDVKHTSLQFEKSSLDYFFHLLETIEQLTDADRIAAVARFEALDPAAFTAIYDVLLTAHYSAPETQARIRALADAGPREPSPHFDPSLLDQVIATQAGKRRL
jgi:hypothetical protein